MSHEVPLNVGVGELVNYLRTPATNGSQSEFFPPFIRNFGVIMVSVSVIYSKPTTIFPLVLVAVWVSMSALISYNYG